MNKIDSTCESENAATNKTMKPVYSTDYELNCGIIKYGDKIYLLDLQDKDNIINFHKRFDFVNFEKEDYPSIGCNYKRFTFLDFIFEFNTEESFYVFKNKNKFDLRRSNVEVYHAHHNTIIEKYQVVEYMQGHYTKIGQDANRIKNPIWRINENGKEYLLMYCEKDTICRLCNESYQKILDYEIKCNGGEKLTWYKHKNGYILSGKGLHIHQIIMNGLGTVTHKDDDLLNNALENLVDASHKTTVKKHIDLYQKYDQIIREKYQVVEYIQGHYNKTGTDANKMKNPIWRISENGKEYILMYCEKDSICRLCNESYQKILDYEINFNEGIKLTWFKTQNGYILTYNTEKNAFYIHQIIMNGLGRVHHKDNDPLNNVLENLHVKTHICIYHEYDSIIREKYQVVEYIQGHHNKTGTDANKMKNPIWRINENGKEYLLMYCEKDSICRLCDESYQKILDYEINCNKGKKLTWYKHQNGYISTYNADRNSFYIHQLIMNCYGNGRGTKTISVDHIDQQPLNNSLENLRIATREEQEQNTKGIKPGTKRERKHNAKDLPEGISQDMMKKYVVYYQEWLDKEHTKEREFFKVETHPKLDKSWTSSKSGKVSIEEKLAQANKVVDDLEQDIYPEKDEPILPKYVSLIIAREKPQLVFEKRVNDKRLNLKMVLPVDYNLQEQLEKLNEKIKEKYTGEYILPIPT
jgi:hypothetical protein